MARAQGAGLPFRPCGRSNVGAHGGGEHGRPRRCTQEPGQLHGERGPPTQPIGAPRGLARSGMRRPVPTGHGRSPHRLGPLRPTRVRRPPSAIETRLVVGFGGDRRSRALPPDRARAAADCRFGPACATQPGKFPKRCQLPRTVGLDGARTPRGQRGAPRRLGKSVLGRSPLFPHHNRYTTAGGRKLQILRLARRTISAPWGSEAPDQRLSRSTSMKRIISIASRE